MSGDPNNVTPPDAPPTAATRPTIVFAVEKGLNPPQIEKQFREEAMNLVFAQNEQDITKAIQGPDCYVVFIGAEFGGNGVAIMRKYLKQTTAYWVVVTGALSTQKTSAMYHAGATDLLNHPVSAAQYKLRAKSMLSRYLKTFDFPPEIILPEGFARRKEGSIQKGAMNENQPREYSHRSGDGSPDEAQKGYNRVQGAEGKEPEVRFHDLSKDKDTQQRTTHDLSAEEGTEVRHHSSDDPSSPEWKNSIGKDSEPPKINRHPSEANPQDTSATKFFTKDAPAGDWTNHASAPTPETPFTNHASTGPANLDEQAARTPQYKTGDTPFDQHDSGPTPETPFTNHPSTPENKPNPSNSLFSGPLARPVSAATPATPAHEPNGLSGALPELEKVLDSLSLLDLIRRKIVLLKSGVPWDPKIWREVGSITGAEFHGLDTALRQLQELFREACKTLDSKRITLVSLRPRLPVEGLPEMIFSLVSSDAVPPNNDKLEIITIPQLRIAFEEKRAFFLDERLPSQIDGYTRTSSWKLNGNIERMSAIIPIFIDQQVGVALFIQYDKPADTLTRGMLEQAVTYLSLPEKQYGIVDFLSRVYREAARR